MKIVIPSKDKKGLDSAVAEHFGRCDTFTFLDENGNIIEIMDNVSKHMGGADLPPKLMKKHGADILLCKNIGPKAIMLCRQLGIEVHVCQTRTVKELFSLWKDKKTKKLKLKTVARHIGINFFNGE